MKKLCIIFIFVLAISISNAQITTQLQTVTQAQQIVDPPPNDTSSSIQITEELPNWPVMLSNLNTTQITSGTLIDKISSFANIINYNSPNENVSSSEHFSQALSELYRASDQTRFISLSELAIRTANTTANNAVDIGIINTTFHKLNFNEETPSAGGLLFPVDRFTIIAGRPSFISKKIIVASPLKKMVTGSSISFKFKTSLILNNATTSIKTLVINFDGTNTSTIITNGIITTPTKTVNFTSSGIKTIKFTTTYTDNSVLITYGTIYVNYVSSNPSAVATTTSLCEEITRVKGTFPSTGTEIANAIPFQGYTETSPVKGKIEYTIFYAYSNTNKQMLKPIIIIDGFDPKDKRKVQDCDCEIDIICKTQNSEYVFNGFSSNPIFSFVFNAEKHKSIEDTMYYVENGDPVNLLDKLRTRGYDVIVINQPTYTTTNQAGQTVTIDGGADYIERNSMNLVNFIKGYIKPQQLLAGSTQQLVLVGPSMGGQISRYALAYMEKKFAETNLSEWQHNARLWVSVDSPHLGANIPVGAQANIWFTAYPLHNEKAKEQYNDELNSIAGKQQLLLQLKNAQENGGTLNNSTFFNTYYANLRNNGVAGSGGYPVTTPTFRKVAMVNGSLSGEQHGFGSQTFLYMRGYIRGFWPFQSSTITLFRFRDNFLPNTGQTGIVFKGDGQNSRSSIQLFNSEFDFSHPRFTLNVTNNSLKGNLDIVPGGAFITAKFIKDAVKQGASDANIRSETPDYIENHSFISSFSALGHLHPNQNWANPLNTNLTCATNKETPFDSYYGAANNTIHTTFTKESADWFFKELDGLPQAPSFPLQDDILSGPNTICLNTNTTYGFDDLCKLPSPVIWSVSSNLQIVSQTGYSIIVNGITNGSGTITATFQNGQTITKNIWVGNPVFNFVRDSGEFCDDKWHYVIFNLNLPPDTTFELSDVTPQPLGITYGIPYSGGEYGVTLKYGLGFNGDISFIGLATNSCGSYYLESEEPTHVNNCNSLVVNRTVTTSGSETIFKIYPNPSNSIVNVDLRDQNLKPESNALINAQLFNMMGEMKSNIIIRNNEASINVTGFPRGIYILKINIDGIIESHQVGVE